MGLFCSASFTSPLFFRMLQSLFPISQWQTRPNGRNYSIFMQACKHCYPNDCWSREKYVTAAADHSAPCCDCCCLVILIVVIPDLKWTNGREWYRWIFNHESFLIVQKYLIFSSTNERFLTITSTMWCNSATLICRTVENRYYTLSVLQPQPQPQCPKAASISFYYFRWVWSNIHWKKNLQWKMIKLFEESIEYCTVKSFSSGWGSYGVIKAIQFFLSHNYQPHLIDMGG